MSNNSERKTVAALEAGQLCQDEDDDGFHEVVSKRVLKIKKQAAIDEAEAKVLLAEQAETARLAKKAKRANRAPKKVCFLKIPNTQLNIYIHFAIKDC